MDESAPTAVVRRGAGSPPLSAAMQVTSGASSAPGDPGRVPGLRPPLPAWSPLAWFTVLAAVLTFVIVALVQPPGPLDDADPAYQRDGLLLDGPLVPEEVLGVEFGGEVVLLLFVREPPPAAELEAWLGAAPETVVLVVPEPTTADLAGSTALSAVVVDSLGKFAEVTQMPVPVDGGRPVGYAVVDAQRLVRYATIDPSYLKNSFELETIVKAVSEDAS